ncbi:hypothetical protein AAC387_Pa03g1181 [Persea americana]
MRHTREHVWSSFASLDCNACKEEGIRASNRPSLLLLYDKEMAMVVKLCGRGAKLSPTVVVTSDGEKTQCG